jgi:predicted Rossmann fold nucleotide-binding protein DprA/Smf involved in DNA uptake
MKKQAAALVAAIVMTVCTGAAIFLIGGAALLNPAGVAPANAASQTSKVADASLVQQQPQLAQLQAQLAQYQAREQDYQNREQQLQQALAQSQTQAQNAEQQARQQTQQVQMLLLALQQRGLITINGDGSITINR